MRQRLFVFVIVTLLAALCIAALQGCDRLTNGLGTPAAPPAVSSATGAAPSAGQAATDGSTPGDGQALGR
jgi:hypothetical protein